MDPFDEFEFKPITEGLGFHNKKNKHKNKNDESPILSTMPQNKLSSHSQSTLGDELTYSPSHQNSDLKLPLPRKKKDSQNHPLTQIKDSTTATVDEILKTLNEKKMDFIEPVPFVDDKAIYASSFIEASAAVLDGMLLIATYLGSLIALIVSTKIDLFTNLYNPDQEGLIYVSLFGLFSMLTFSYLVIHRIFLGFTPGEWVFDQRLGLPQQVGQAQYSLKVTARAALIVISGFVLFPILSLILRRDVLGKLIHLELMKKAN